MAPKVPQDKLPNDHGQNARGAAATATLEPPTRPTGPTPAQPAPTEASPAHTAAEPQTPPPGISADGTVAVQAATPPSEAAPLPPNPFADELPPGFWGEDVELPEVAPSPALDAAVAATYEPPNPTPSAAAPARAVAGKLEDDPRFVLLTQLFPGRISDWQSSETPAVTAEDGAEDAPDSPETVDLEEDLDSDDTDETADDL